jgi:hypothetical protein
MRARAGSRAGFNVIVQDLRAVGRGGLLAAGADSIVVRVPVAFGLTCSQPPGGVTAISLFPPDSVLLAGAVVAGYAWRDSTTAWNVVEPAAVANDNAPLSDCSGAAPKPIAVIPGGRVIRVSPNDAATPAASPVYLYQVVRYRIAVSTELPGRLALWREVSGGSGPEELVAPYDTGTTFSFLVGNALTRQAAPPASLDSVRGVRLRLVGQSETPAEGRSVPTRFDLATDIVFVNRVP